LLEHKELVGIAGEIKQINLSELDFIYIICYNDILICNIFTIFMEQRKTLTKEQALYCAGIFNDYFCKFDRIDQYMRDQKLSQLNATVSASLPGMGPETEIFDNFDMSPEEMNFEIDIIANDRFDTLLNMISSHTNMSSVPGKNLKLAIRETNTNKFVGFIRLASPVINMKPRNQLLGNVPELTTFNKTTIMGFVIVPSQPFGFNYLGGKLLAAICCTHEVRKMMNDKYNMNLVLFETTSLYGNSKSSSQYDGMKPFLRYRGLTDSDFIPLIHGKPYHDLVNFVENKVGKLVKDDASSKKLKLTTAIISLVKRSLNDLDLEKFNTTISNAKKLTERKRYYTSGFGIKNYVDIVNNKTIEIIKDENYDKHYLNNIIEWWKKKATSRYNNLKK
jgi:hypothetical protein